MIRQATVTDAAILAKLAIQMWTENTPDELEKDFSETIRQSDAVFFIKYVEDRPVGFAQCQLRHDYVEGTDTSPVGYLEGIYVEEPFRKKGYAKELLQACESWAKSKGCSEFASDCELENVNSFRFHMAMHFEEANRIICFRKSI